MHFSNMDSELSNLGSAFGYILQAQRAVASFDQRCEANLHLNAQISNSLDEAARGIETRMRDYFNDGGVCSCQHCFFFTLTNSARSARF